MTDVVKAGTRPTVRERQRVSCLSTRTHGQCTFFRGRWRSRLPKRRRHGPEVQHYTSVDIRKRHRPPKPQQRQTNTEQTLGAVPANRGCLALYIRPASGTTIFAELVSACTDLLDILLPPSLENIGGIGSCSEATWLPRDGSAPFPLALYLGLI